MIAVALILVAMLTCCSNGPVDTMLGAKTTGSNCPEHLAAGINDLRFSYTAERYEGHPVVCDPTDGPGFTGHVCVASDSGGFAGGGGFVAVDTPERGMCYLRFVLIERGDQ